MTYLLRAATKAAVRPAHLQVMYSTDSTPRKPRPALDTAGALADVPSVVSDPVGPFSERLLLTVSETAELLNIPESTLRKWVSLRKVPFTRLSRYVRFSPQNVIAISATGNREANATQEPLRPLDSAEPLRQPRASRPLASQPSRGAQRAPLSE